MLLLCTPNLEYAVSVLQSGNETRKHCQSLLCSTSLFQDVIMKFIYLGELYQHYSLEAKLKNIVIIV